MMKSDKQVKKEVLDELSWLPNVNDNEIGVTVNDGAVTLMGKVDSYTEKKAAESAAKGVKGVRAIAQEIEVRLPESMIGRDEQIAEQISHMLKWSTSLKDSNIQARVSNGFVTLDGEVKWVYEKNSAKRQIEDLEGVTGIYNKITVKKPVSVVNSADIKKQISSALHRRANIEASKVKLSVENGKVTLDGTVDTFYERELIADAVWACRGVDGVIDRLRVH